MKGERGRRERRGKRNLGKKRKRMGEGEEKERMEKYVGETGDEEGREERGM